ncbi:hypothetical protein [Kitasatospora sp. NPDC004272]
MEHGPLLTDDAHWAELSSLHRWRTRSLVDHHEERIKRSELERDLQQIAQLAATLADRSKRMPCLLRMTPGAERTSYHSADFPCGRVTGHGRDIGSFVRAPEDRIPYADPKWSLILVDRCTACAWNAAAMAYGRQLLDTCLPTK